MKVLAVEQILTTPTTTSTEKLKIVVEELHNFLKADHHGTAKESPPSAAPLPTATEPPAMPNVMQLPNNICIGPLHSPNDAAAIRATATTTTAIAASGCPTTVPGISQLLPTLYLSGAGVAIPNVCDRLQVRFVISAAPELPDTPLSDSSKPLYLRVNVLDRPDVDLSVHFDTVADMIEEVRQHGGSTLVHCVAGVSRSASLCLAYLMKHAGMSLRDAYTHVKSVRPQIRPNSGFFQQLMRYERQLHGTASVRMVFYESLNKEIPDVYESEYRPMEEFYQRHRNALKRR